MGKEKIHPRYTRAEQKKLCDDAFTTYDNGQKGFLNRKELMAFANELNTTLGYEKCLNQIQENKIIKLLDEDGNGNIDPEELLSNFELVVAVLKIPSQKMADIVKRSFFIYDIEMKGYLSRPQLRMLLADTCDMMNFLPQNEDQIEEIYGIIDENGDGEIELDELAQNIELINDLLVYKYNNANLAMEKGSQCGTRRTSQGVSQQNADNEINRSNDSKSKADEFFDAARPANFILGLKKNLRAKKRNKMAENSGGESALLGPKLKDSTPKGGRDSSKRKSKAGLKEPIRASMTLDAFNKDNEKVSKILLPMATLVNQITTGKYSKKNQTVSQKTHPILVDRQVTAPLEVDIPGKSGLGTPGRPTLPGGQIIFQGQSGDDESQKTRQRKKFSDQIAEDFGEEQTDRDEGEGTVIVRTDVDTNADRSESERSQPCRSDDIDTPQNKNPTMGRA